MDKLLRDFVSDLERMPELGVALDSLAKVVGGFGFASVDYGFVKAPIGPNGKIRPIRLFVRNFPPRFEDAWRQFAVSDPFYLAGLKRMVPIDATTLRDWVCEDSQQQKAWAYLDKTGLTQAVLIPMHLPGGGYSTVAAYWRGRLSDDQWQTIYDKYRDIIFLVAHHFQDTISRLSILPEESESEVYLTTRERECLELIAQGKTTDEVALLLGRSPVTVRFHLGNAFRKLGATNRVGAIAQALRLGQISLH